MHLDIGDRPSISQARGRLRPARGADGDEGDSTQCHRRRMQIVRDDGGHGVATAHVRRSRTRSPRATAAVEASGTDASGVEVDVVAAVEADASGVAVALAAALSSRRISAVSMSSSSPSS